MCTNMIHKFLEILEINPCNYDNALCITSVVYINLMHINLKCHNKFYVDISYKEKYNLFTRITLYIDFLM